MEYTIETAITALQSGEATIEEIAEATGWEVVDDCLVPEPDVWSADDGNAEVTYDGIADAEGRYHYGHEPKVDSGEEAANAYVENGDWGDRSSTDWVEVTAWRDAINADGEWVRVDEDTHTVEIEAQEPDCTHRDGHDWRAPLSIVGGCKENPGVYGHGGGVTIQEVCAHCGCGKLTDTWAQDSCGRQGLTSVSYEAGKYEDEAREWRRENLPLRYETNNYGEIEDALQRLGATAEEADGLTTILSVEGWGGIEDSDLIDSVLEERIVWYRERIAELDSE